MSEVVFLYLKTSSHTTYYIILLSRLRRTRYYYIIVPIGNSTNAWSTGAIAAVFTREFETAVKKNKKSLPPIPFLK